jgi:3-hydroxyacyl-CoA dehydrogenase/enoyl-CoA hydratase/3-hydroxybutyryl-CoA epimerase
MKKSVSYESTSRALALEWTDDNIAVITFNDLDKSVNAFSRPILEDLGTLLDDAFASPSIAGIVFRSGKKGSFAAGVDISIFDTLHTAEDGKNAAQTLQQLFGRLENSKVTTVAAIDGVCLGGGLELALACHYRVASTNEATKLGLPEVQIGILPGGGGTQRLPRLIGLTESLGLILTGKQVDAKKARRLGLVNETVPPNQLLDAALRMCKSNKPFVRKAATTLRDELSDLAQFDVNKVALEGTSIGRALIRRKSLDQVLKNTKGHYPAPIKALESVMWGFSRPFEEGLANEAKLFGDLVASPESRSLVHVFKMMTAAKKNPYAGEVQAKAKATYIGPVTNGASPIGIIGAGLMGSGVATVLASKGIRTVLQDRDGAGVAKGLAAVSAHFDERVKKRRMHSSERIAAVATVCPATEFNTLRNAKIVVEAVFEDLRIKHGVLRKCEQSCPSDFIFATNTSSIPITEIASAARNPANVVGMHFFSPVPKMPLVEIIKTPKTDPQAVAAIFDLGSKMGKNLIVVNDGPGFYTTRILAFFIAEALCILSEGASIEDIDKALEQFGMPVGPVTLLDEVGIDVGSHIIRVLKEPFAARLKVPAEVEAVEKDDRKGRKNNRGFYLYENGKKQGIDPTIYKHFSHGSERLRVDRKEIADRCIMVFLNEAARCLSEGIISSPDDGDMGAVFGLGFPPFLGGPFHYAKTLGHANVRAQLQTLAGKYGSRFEPDAYWLNPEVQ